MSKSKITKRMLENANKVAFLVQSYPEKSMPNIIGLLQLPPIDINTAIWAAVELQFITEMDQRETLPAGDTGDETAPNPHYTFADVGKLPKDWDFGEVIPELEDAILYAFEKLNADEKDMEENYLTNWLGGYLAHDSLIALRHLLADGALHEYTIEEQQMDEKGKPLFDEKTKEPVMNEYIFYTLKANAGKNWGAKQFKTNPITGDDQRTPEQIAADEAAANDAKK